MPTVLRVGPYRVMIFTDDHPPPHVHVVRDGRMVKIALSPEVTTIEYDSRLRSQLGKMEGIIEENLEFLLEKWEEIHPNKED